MEAGFHGNTFHTSLSAPSASLGCFFLNLMCTISLGCILNAFQNADINREVCLKMLGAEAGETYRMLGNICL